MLERETDAFLNAYNSGKVKVEYSESAGLTGIDIDSMSEILGRCSDSQVKIPSHDQVELISSYVEILSEWSKLQITTSSSGSSSGSKGGKGIVRLDVSSLKDILDLDISSHHLVDKHSAQTPLSEKLRVYRDDIVTKVNNTLQSAAPAIKKARKQLEYVSLANIDGIHGIDEAYKELLSLDMVSEEEKVLVAVVQAFKLTNDVKAFQSRARPQVDLIHINDLASAERRSSLISADAPKQLQIDMNKVRKGHWDYLNGCMRLKLTWILP